MFFLIMLSFHLFHRAEVVLGNIIKKKGWRYDMRHTLIAFCIFLFILFYFFKFPSQPSGLILYHLVPLHILGGLCVVNRNSKVGR